jgi:hypothetical protein
MNCLKIKKKKKHHVHINSKRTMWRWDHYMPHHVSAFPVLRALDWSSERGLAHILLPRYAERTVEAYCILKLKEVTVEFPVCGRERFVGMASVLLNWIIIGKFHFECKRNL